MTKNKQREPASVIGKLFARVSLAFRMLFREDFRSVLACKTLWDQYGHALNKIRLGEKLVPWYTYSFLEHLEVCDLTNLEVFEFGGGGSTLFWAKSAKSVTTVEKNPEWFDKINVQISGIPSATCILQTDESTYTQAIQKTGKKFDVIVIDGHWRLKSAHFSIECLKNQGVIILDNSDWCPKTCEFLRKSGFSRIDFGGLGPSNQFSWSTSIFFKQEAIQSSLLTPISLPSTKGWVSYQYADYMFAGEEA